MMLEHVCSHDPAVDDLIELVNLYISHLDRSCHFATYSGEDIEGDAIWFTVHGKNPSRYAKCFCSRSRLLIIFNSIPNLDTAIYHANPKCFEMFKDYIHTNVSHGNT